MRAAELSRKSRRRRRASEVPAQIVEVVFAATESKTSFDASRRMKGVHVVQLFAEAARRHGDLDYVDVYKRQRLFGATDAGTAVRPIW